jgi:hypothetical protein
MFQQILRTKYHTIQSWILCALGSQPILSRIQQSLSSSASFCKFTFTSLLSFMWLMRVICDHVFCSSLTIQH